MPSLLSERGWDRVSELAAQYSISRTRLYELRDRAHDALGVTFLDLEAQGIALHDLVRDGARGIRGDLREAKLGAARHAQPRRLLDVGCWGTSSKRARWLSLTTFKLPTDI